MLKKITYLFTFIIWASISNAQNNNDGIQQNNIEQNIENINENASNQDLDYTTLLEQYSFYTKHPINLNSKDIESLRDLNLVSDIQVGNLLRHIRRNGELFNVYELQSIDSWDIPSIQKIMPFVYVSDPNDNIRNISFKKIIQEADQTIDIRTQRILESQAGFSKVNDSIRNANPNKYFLGDQYKHFFRYRFNSNNRVMWGITAEKDPGEEFFNGTQKNGFDYYSAHLFLKNFGKIKALALGDYKAEFGQGLTFWTDLAYSKSVDLLVYKKNAKGIRAYNSLNENQYLRGAAATILLHENIEATVFFSRKKRDATVTSDTTEAATDEGFSNFILSGLHRTPSELAKKNSVTEILCGANVQYKKRTFTLGATAVSTQFDVTQKIPNDLYRKYDMTGAQNVNLGVDYNFVYKNIDFFGEVATSKNGGKAFVSGALASLDPKLNFLALYRNYERNYQALYVRAIGETVGAQNEKGILLGLQFKPLYNITISAYYDRFTFPWLRYKIDLPNQSGNDFTCFADYAISKKIDLNMRFRRRYKPLDNIGITEGIKTVGNTIHDLYRFNAVYSITAEIRLKSRIDFNYFTAVDGKKSSGYLFFQDIVYKKALSPITFTMRYAIFDVNGFDARIYALESDLPYAYTFFNYNGRGNRFYMIVNYDINKKLEFWVRYGQTFYVGEQALNVGTQNESAGPIRSELKVQFRYKF